MTTELTIYQYSKCDTCRDALKSLAAKGRKVHRIEIFENPPNPLELKQLIQMSGLELKKFFNTSGEVYKEMQLKDKIQAMSEEEKINLLSSNGRLIKRPIVTDGSRVTVGFKEDDYIQVWS